MSSVTNAQTVTTTHTMFVAAPPRAVYDLIADPTRWPYLFAPIVHAERLTGVGAPRERLRLWAVANGAVRSWTSRRNLDPDALRIRFRHENPTGPVAEMAGEWVFVPLPDNATSVVLLHEFRAVGDDPANTALITQAVDRSSTAELAAVRHIAELGERLPLLVHSFADSVTVESERGPVYDFLYRAREWPQRLPHVTRLVLDEAVPNVQTIEMDAWGVDGLIRTTGLVRVCFPYEAIVYKQTHPLDVMSAYVGRWRLFPVADGVRVTSHHTVVVRPEKACRALGTPGSVERAREVIRRALTRNSMITLMHAKQVAEGRAVALPDELLAPAPGTPLTVAPVD